VPEPRNSCKAFARQTGGCVADAGAALDVPDCFVAALLPMTTTMRIALYQPDQAGNVGTVIRLAACMGVPLDVIEPCGFPFSDRALKRAGMDYAEMAAVTRHAGWSAFEAGMAGRLVLFTTAGAVRLPDARFGAGDVLLFGSESRGVPEEVHARAALRVRIPQVEGTRSLNLAVAAGIGLAEALRQKGAWPS
jgi:tRNA (cytidine/uridine-2'-O-)-methyltransferase